MSIAEELFLSCYPGQNMKNLKQIDNLILETYNKEEILPEYSCPECGVRGELRCRTSIQETGRILLIRIVLMNYVNEQLKVITVECLSQILKQRIDFGPNSNYDLNSIVCHLGSNRSIDSGHYITYLKDNISKQWCLANDSNIKSYKIS